MSLDDLFEHVLSVIDLKMKLKISPTNKSTWHWLRIQTHSWLKRSHMFPTAEEFVFAIQDKAISKCSCLKYIIKAPKVVIDIYYLCGSSSDTVQHVIVSCPKLVHIKWKNRHEPIAKFYIRNCRSSFFLGNNILQIFNTSSRSFWKMTAAHCARIAQQHWLIEHIRKLHFLA